MVTKIGPSFPDELRAAGITDWRFSWGAEGKGPEDLLEFHPDFPADERAKVEAVLAAHDGPLSEARHQALEAADAEAARRIGRKFGKEPHTDELNHAQLNALAKAIQIINKKIEGSALPEERLVLEVLDMKYGEVEAIRAAEKDAEAALKGAKSVEEVEAVIPAWPKD
jgi:hypothetical protein